MFRIPSGIGVVALPSAVITRKLGRGVSLKYLLWSLSTVRPGYQLPHRLQDGKKRRPLTASTPAKGVPSYYAAGINRA